MVSLLSLSTSLMVTRLVLSWKPKTASVPLALLLISAMAFLMVFGLSACHQQTDDEKAQPMLDEIEARVNDGDFRPALDSIVILRNRYPKAIKAREKALELWQKASLLQAQHEVEVTDSALQATLIEIENAPTRFSTKSPNASSPKSKA